MQYLVSNKMKGMHGRPIILQLYRQLFCWLYYYNKPITSQKNNPSFFVYYLLFIKWNFIFTMRKVVWLKLDWPDQLLQTCITTGYRKSDMDPKYRETYHRIIISCRISDTETRCKEYCCHIITGVGTAMYVGSISVTSSPVAGRLEHWPMQGEYCCHITNCYRNSDTEPKCKKCYWNSDMEPKCKEYLCHVITSCCHRDTCRENYRKIITSCRNSAKKQPLSYVLLHQYHL